MTKQRISLNPNPPTQGQNVSVCYTFEGTALGQTTLEVTFNPGAHSSSHMVTPDSPCASVAVPDSATSVTIVDEDGPSPNKEAPVDPQHAVH